MGNVVVCAATIGAVTVPVNTRFKADGLLYSLKQADVPSASPLPTAF